MTSFPVPARISAWTDLIEAAERFICSRAAISGLVASVEPSLRELLQRSNIPFHAVNVVGVGVQPAHFRIRVAEFLLAVNEGL